MKKHLLFLTSVVAGLSMLAACDKTENPGAGSDAKVVATLSQDELVDAVSSMYAEWQKTTAIPQSLAVGKTTLTLPQYQYAICRLVVDLAESKSAPVEVLSYKAADHPERDSYDMETIAVTAGPANAIENGASEDMVWIASKILSSAKAKGQIPNQTNLMRSETIAFSTNRATVTLSRVIAAYKADGKLPVSVSTEYLSAAATLKGFAEQLVSYLDVWDKTVGNLSADGSHCSDNGSAWQNVHFIPVPYSGGYADGKDQYAPEFQPYHTIEVDGVTYDAAQCFVIAIKGILDMITVEGSAKQQEERNTPVHTLGNGKSLTAPIPAAPEWALWGNYPWYEKSDEPIGVINFSSERPCDNAFLVRVIPWFLTRASQLGHIGNFMSFDTENPDNNLSYEPYRGIISPMRTFLIAIRFYKYLLDNNITDNIYDAVKDIDWDYDLYGVELPALEISKTEYNIESVAGSTVSVTFNATKDWTITSSESWLSVSPASGSASNAIQVVVTAEANTGAERSAVLKLKAGDMSVDITVTQSAHIDATIKDFAEQYVKILDIWEKTTGTVNMVTGLTLEGDNYDEANNIQNAHYVPSDTKISVCGVEYNTADMLELALRSYAILRGLDGHYTASYGVDSTPKLESAGTLSSALPATHGYVWGSMPFNEGSGNGGPLMMGSSDDPDNAIANTVKLDILDNWLERNMNWAIKNTGISNMSGYPRGPITGYYGAFCAQRGLITYARVFKYVLDNKLDNLVGVSADQTFDSDYLGAGK